MRILALLLLAGLLSLTACMPQKPISKTPAENNGDYKVAYLFEHEGCKVYRFIDNGTCVYFTNCNGQAIAKVDSATTNVNSTHVK